MAVFTSAAKAMAYMQAQTDGQWAVRLVSRTSKSDTAVFFAQEGVTHVCCDQNPDGTGGELIPVRELLSGWTL